jgi:hypothetical protein
VLDGLSIAVGLERHGHKLTNAMLRTAAGTRILTATVPSFGPGPDHVLAVRRGWLLADLLAAVGATTG